MFRFIVTKIWCFKDGSTTYGYTGRAETWIRPDLKRSAEKGGWDYAEPIENGTESFVSYDGRSRGAHKSSRTGAFLYYPPRSDIPTTMNLAGVVQYGLYNGGCKSVQYVPEVTRITSGPSGVVANRTATFGFSAGRDASYQCELDGKGFERCTSPARFTSLGQGTHTFRVRATNAAGNALPIVERRWTVNTTAPRIVSVVPASGVAGVSPSVTVKAKFSKSIDELSLYGGNFVLREVRSGALVDGSVSYAPGIRTASLNPFDNLKAGVAYRAEIRGGRSGVTDTSGLKLPQNKYWTFTVAASG